MNIWTGKKILCIKNTNKLKKGFFYEVCNHTKDFKYVKIKIGEYIKIFLTSHDSNISNYDYFHDFFITKNISEIRKEKIEKIIK